MRNDLPHDWLERNRENWDERVAIHLDAPEYELTSLKDGRGRLDPIVESQVGDVSDLRILHLQCHFGRDSLILAQQGADVVGVDFSRPAVETARKLAEELDLRRNAGFHQANVLEADSQLDHIGKFDMVFVSWGTICWLPDVARWAEVVSHFLKPGGALRFTDSHPAALVLDDEAPEPDGRPGWFLPYAFEGTFTAETSVDYVTGNKSLSTVPNEWMHPLSAIMNALIGAGLRIDRIDEHDAIVWPMFKMLVKGADDLYRWPDKAWFPLSLSLQATKI